MRSAGSGSCAKGGLILMKNVRIGMLKKAAAWLLAQTGVVTNVWWAFLIAECVSLMLSLFFFRKVHRDIIDKL